MSSQCFYNKYLLTNICSYNTPKEIILFSSCNKTISDNLNPSNNSVINNIMYYHVSQTIFEFDEEESNTKKERKNVMGNSWKSSVNWNLYLNQISKLFKLYPDPKISKSVFDYFKIHLYLSDLRKENNNLEYSFSSSHMLFSYDVNFREACKRNYYENYINNNYIINKGKNCKQIQVLKEQLPFESNLKNFYDEYNEMKSNEEYKSVINNIINYDCETLEKIYDNLEHNNNNKINSIIYFILWINKCLLTHCIYTYESIVRFVNSSDEKPFLVNYANKYDEYINVSLLINSNYDNVNIIMNYVNQYIMNNSENSTKFSLYELARKIFKKNVFDKISETVYEKTSFLLKEYYEKKFDETNQNDENNKDKEENEDYDDYEMNYDELDDTNDTSENMEESKNEFDNKALIEKTINTILDINIDRNNANAINHSQIKLSAEYEKIEGLLNSKLCEIIQKKLNEEEKDSEIFEILEKSLKNEKNNYFSFYYNKHSLKIINRTKKNLLKSTFKTMCGNLLQKLIKDFASRLRINNNERKLYIKSNEIEVDYKCDLTDFSQEKIMKIEGKVQEEINNIKTRLYERNINGYNVNDTFNLVNQYIDNDGIEIVLLVKKMIYFYFKELEFYEEKDQKVFNLLTNKGNLGEKALNEMILKN